MDCELLKEQLSGAKKALGAADRAAAGRRQLELRCARRASSYLVMCTLLA